ncbi:hypothetical protein BC936DRAFT_136573 [Jimgerdemannia flammicorona]|uniref:Uncharacterized protein n=1 Tax=Jimgerdemannia flammicorona TaxID=994334 RepID=A0A433CZ77_9FUNG|nr:hypothetical protein BC936DRAFT_136573 [Jimgerdemannia flammicorona]
MTTRRRGARRSGSPDGRENRDTFTPYCFVASAQHLWRCSENCDNKKLLQTMDNMDLRQSTQYTNENLLRHFTQSGRGVSRLLSIARGLGRLNAIGGARRTVTVGRGGFLTVTVGRGGRPTVTIGRGGRPTVTVGRGGRPTVTVGRGGFLTVTVGRGGFLSLGGRWIDGDIIPVVDVDARQGSAASVRLEIATVLVGVVTVGTVGGRGLTVGRELAAERKKRGCLSWDELAVLVVCRELLVVAEGKASGLPREDRAIEGGSWA